MLRLRMPSATTVVAFIAGITVATAGTAGAARLITGKQIKNGSITQADLAKQIRSQLAKAGTPGPRGRRGVRGAAGAAGAAGPAGPPGGPQQLVKDANGAVVGTLLGASVGGTATVARDGGIWLYQSDGKLSGADDPGIYYKQSDCSGPAYLQSSEKTPVLLGRYRGARRYVSRPVANYELQAASAWQVAADTQEEKVSGLQLYYNGQQNGSTVCTVGSAFTGGLLTLTPVTAPPDFSPPLSIG